MGKLFTPAAPYIIRGEKVRDVAFQFRMGAGFAGEVNRTHPASIEPAVQDGTNPVLGYGFAVLATTSGNSVRQMASGDTSVTSLYGISVRPFPTQQSTTSTAYAGVGLGATVPPAAGAIDILRAGYIMVNIVGTPVKGGAAFVWVAASSGSHLQGGFEAAATGGSTASIANVIFNGPPDANGIGEVIIRI